VAGPALAGNRRPGPAVAAPRQPRTLAGRDPGTVEYEVALEPVDEYSLDWWFRCVDDAGILAWP